MKKLQFNVCFMRISLTYSKYIINQSRNFSVMINLYVNISSHVKVCAMSNLEIMWPKRVSIFKRFNYDYITDNFRITSLYRACPCFVCLGKSMKMFCEAKCIFISLVSNRRDSFSWKWWSIERMIPREFCCWSNNIKTIHLVMT